MANANLASAAFDLGTRGAQCRSGARHGHFATVTGVRSAGRGYPWPSPGARRRLRMHSHCRAPDRLAPMPRGRASMICRASHSAVGCRVTSNHSSCRRPWPTNQTSAQSSASGTTHISTAAIAPAWFWRNVLQDCEGGLRSRTMYLETVDWATSNLSLPKIRSVWICSMSQNHRIMWADVCDPARALDLRGRHFQVATQAGSREPVSSSSA